ncbi:MAG: GxxExxY protein, partial [Candidatus Edwardsbacteria bacterium]|nr:GxxExxY protein [Candidatus Edwardsbacteria bacterium]
PFRRECPVPIDYKGEKLDPTYRADFICCDAIITELKALTTLSGNDEAQVIHYLKATELKKALLINFGKPRLEYKRFILNVYPQITQMNADSDMDPKTFNHSDI